MACTFVSRIVLRFVAEMRSGSHGETADEIAAATLHNARRVFCGGRHAAAERQLH